MTTILPEAINAIIKGKEGKSNIAEGKFTAVPADG
jgi:hypothetical protein